MKLIFGMRVPGVIINKYTKNGVKIFKDVRVISETPGLATDARVPRPQTSGSQNKNKKLVDNILKRK